MNYFYSLPIEIRDKIHKINQAEYHKELISDIHRLRELRERDHILIDRFVDIQDPDMSITEFYRLRTELFDEYRHLFGQRKLKTYFTQNLIAHSSPNHVV